MRTQKLASIGLILATLGACSASVTSATGDAQPTAVLHGVTPQPTLTPKNWEWRPLDLPDIAGIIKQSKPNPYIYGVYLWAGEYKTHHDDLKKIGWRSFRMGGSFDDDTMKMIAADDVRVMPTLTPNKKDLNPDVAHLDDSPYIKAYADHCADFVKRYGPGGTFFKENPGVPNHPVLSVEICNEPNFQYLIPPDGRPQAELEKDREKLYAALLPAAYNAIKAANPAVSVIGFGAGGAGAGDMRFIQHVHDDSPAVAKSYDVLSTHPYVTPAPPEGWAIHSWGGYSTVNSFNVIRKTMQQYGRGDAPVWYTEVGWPISHADGGRYPTKGDMTPIDLQAAYVCRLYALAQRLGVPRVDIMFLVDTDHFNGGFLAPDATWRPSAVAVQNMIKLMPVPKLAAAIDDGKDGTFIYRFDSGDPHHSSIVMAWNVLGPKTVDIDMGKKKGELIDMLGKSTEVAPQPGKWRIEVGPLPVYLRND